MAQTGTIVWFDPRARWGFLKPDDGGPDIFVRAFGKVRDLDAGVRVEYRIGGTSSRPEAIIVDAETR
jgi:cold shock CspA family protein